MPPRAKSPTPRRATPTKSPTPRRPELAKGADPGLNGGAWAVTSSRRTPKRVSSPPAAKPVAKPQQKKETVFVSYLDRLQKDAQASELDFTNTSSGFFIFLSLVQVPVVLLLSYAASPSTADAYFLNRFSYMALFNIAFHWAGYLVALMIKSVWHFDITEDVGYFISIGLSYQHIATAPSLRQTIAYACGLLWCVRICAFVGYRVLVRGSDWRFDKLNMAKAYQLFGWTSGGTWCWANGFCLWHVADARQAAPLGLPDYLGLAIFAFGILFELMADIQKYRFNAAHPSGSNKRWIASGLWARSRHPNYFGETTLWLGLSLLCMSGDFTPSSVGVCLVTPLWSFVFLLFTSLMLLEKRADAKWGRDPQYLKYKAQTPVWMPKLFV